MNNDVDTGHFETQRERHVRRLHAWLEERAVDASLPILEEEAAFVPEAPRARAVAVNAGDIRLLPPDGAETSRRLLYVAVLRVGADGILAAPFSRYRVPAVPGELATGRPHPVLAVLCLWNAVTLPRSGLTTSWCADQLSSDELMDALWVWRFAIGEAQLPPHLEDHIGPPLEHADDPRWRYCQEEARTMELVQEAHVRTYPESQADRPMAAESSDGDEYGSS